MKIKLFQTLEEQNKKFYVWQEWYAWRPILLDGTVVWLEKVERVRCAGWDHSFWRYRLIDKYIQEL